MKGAISLPGIDWKVAAVVAVAGAGLIWYLQSRAGAAASAIKGAIEAAGIREAAAKVDEETAKMRSEVDQRLSDISSATGLTIKSMAHFDDLTKTGQLVYDETSPYGWRRAY